MSVASQTRVLIDDANALINETYPIVKNPKLFMSAISDCKAAMSGIIIEVLHGRGITFDAVPEIFTEEIENKKIEVDSKMMDAIRSHDYAAALLRSYTSREVDFYRDDAYYMIGENNTMTRITIGDVSSIIRSAKELYELWYE